MAIIPTQESGRTQGGEAPPNQAQEQDPQEAFLDRMYGPTPEPGQETAGATWKERARDMLLVAPRESINFLNETTNFVNDALTGSAQLIQKTGLVGPLSDLNPAFKAVDFLAQETDALNIPQVVPEYETGTGHFVGTLARFGIGIATLQGPRKVAVRTVASQAAKRVPALMRLAERNPRLAAAAGIMLIGATEGALLDTVIFDPEENTLAEMVTEWGGGPEALQALSGWLDSDIGDTRMEMRAKNALEGMLVGAAFDSIFAGFRAWRMTRKANKLAEAGDIEGAKAAAEQAEKHLDEVDAAGEGRPTDVVEVSHLDDGTPVVVEAGRLPEQPKADDLWATPTDQPITSKATARNQAAAGFKKADKQGGFVKGGKNIDIGGGQYDKGTEFMASKGVDSRVFDPFNRDAAHNADVVGTHAGGQSDTATIFNVLNVIESEPGQIRVLRQAEEALKDGGTVHIDVHAGKKADQAAGPRSTGTDSFQQFKKPAEYLEVVRKVFPDAQLKGGIITGTKGGKAPAPKIKATVKTAEGGSDITYRNEAGEVVGTARLVGETASDVAVVPKFRNQGIGTEIAKDVKARGGTSGIGMTEGGRALMKSVGIEDLQTGAAKAEPRAEAVRGVYKSDAEAHAAAATINDEVYRATRAKHLSDEEAAMVHELAEEFKRAETPEDIAFMMQRRDFNVERLDTEDDFIAWINAVSEVMDGLSKGTRTLDETAEQADKYLFGRSRAQLLDEMRYTADLTGTLDSRLAAFRLLVVQQAAAVDRVARLAANNPDDIMVADALGAQLDRLFEAASFTTKITSDVARTLSAMRIKVGSMLGKAGDEVDMSGVSPVTRDSMQGLTPAERINMARKVKAQGGDATGIMKIVTSERMLARARRTMPPSQLQRFAHHIQRYQINGMLSGLRTHEINFISNMVMMVTRPTANIVGGVIARDGAGVRYGLDQMAMSYSVIGEALRMGWKALKTGEAILDPFRTMSELDDHLRHIAQREAPKTLAQKALRMGNNTIDAPMRFLLAGDEIFKQIAYRAEVGARAMGEARSSNSITDMRLLVARGKQAADDSITLHGEGTNSRAIEGARKQTWQQDLGPLGQAVMTALNNMPFGMGRVVVPFVRTPTNIFKSGIDHSFFAPLTVRFWKAIKEGGTEGQEVVGRMTIGATLQGTAYMLYASGNLTGGGPNDPGANKAWREVQGNKPYSFRFPGTNKWINYGRVEPFGTVLGMLADASDAYGEARHDDKGFIDGSIGISLALVESLKDKTYMRGAMQFITAITSGEGKQEMLADYTRQVSTRVIPFSAMLRSIDQAAHPEISEARTLWEHWRNTVPGWGNGPTRRNVLGEEILRTPRNARIEGTDFANIFNVMTNPFTVSTPFTGELVRVLDEIGKGYSMPPETLLGTDISLVDQKYAHPETGKLPYDRWMELVGQENIRQTLEDEVETNRFKNLSGTTALMPGGAQYLRINGLINKAHNDALRNMLREYPDLDTAVNDWKRRKRAAVTGGQDAVDRIEEELKRRDER